jgi:hypothetical protein
MALSLRLVNIEEGRPSVPRALVRLTQEVRTAQLSKVTLLKVIHGYGSSGVGGDLRIALQSAIQQMLERHEIRDCIYGENWRRSDTTTWELIKRFPALKNDRDFERGNRGITIIVL